MKQAIRTFATPSTLFIVLVAIFVIMTYVDNGVATGRSTNTEPKPTVTETVEPTEQPEPDATETAPLDEPQVTEPVETTQPTEPEQTPPPVVTGEWDEDTVRAAFSLIDVEAEGTLDGYDREGQFGGWRMALPEYGWGPEVEACNVRWAVIWRDGTNLAWEDQDDCHLVYWEDEVSGWEDVFGTEDETGAVTFQPITTDPSTMDVDHIVPIAEAYRSGANAWDQELSQQFYNDELNLVLAPASVNRSKGDSDAYAYLPPSDFRCEYVSRYVQVKAKYDLTIDEMEYYQLRQSIIDCSK